MALNLSKLHAAAQKLEQQQAQARKEEPKRTNNTRSTRTNTTAKATKPKSTTKTDTKVTTPYGQYVIEGGFKQRIEDYLVSRGDMAEKMARKDKSLDDCCKYLFARQYKIAMKARKGGGAVGTTESDDETFGWAVHYYDESNEDLKKELEG